HRPMISEARVRAGISGAGSATGVVSCCGVVVQPPSTAARQTRATVGHPKLGIAIAYPPPCPGGSVGNERRSLGIHLPTCSNRTVNARGRSVLPGDTLA